MTAFGPYKAKVRRVVDGDTVIVDLHLSKHPRSIAAHDLGFEIHTRPDGLWLDSQHVRLRGINAPEKTTDAGKASQAWLRELLPAGTDVMVVSHGWDKYGGRIDGDLGYGGHDVATLAVDAGQAKPWDGKGPNP